MADALKAAGNKAIAEKNFDEAAKCYMRALKLDPENGNILRDLSFLQIQMRNYDGFTVCLPLHIFKFYDTDC